MSEICGTERGRPGTPASVEAATAVFFAPPSTVAEAAVCQPWAVIAMIAMAVSMVGAALQACCGRKGRSNGEVALFTGEKWLIQENEN